MLAGMNPGIIKKTWPLSIAFAISVIAACDDPTMPGADYQPPRTLNCIFEDNSVKLTWQPSENNGETGYEIWRAVGCQETYKRTAEVAKSCLNYTDKAIVLNKKYYYKVRTVYEGNPGEFSNEIYLETMPEAPRYLQAFYNGNAMRITWESSVTGAETGYEVWRKPDRGSYEIVAKLPKNRKDFTDTVITKGEYNFYKIRAIYGEKTGPWSSELPALANYLWAVNYVNKIPFYKIEPNSMKVLGSFGFDAYDPRGLTFFDKHLWTTGYKRTHEYESYMINKHTGSIVDSFYSVVYYQSFMTSDRKHLWVSYVDRIIQYEPYTGSIINNFQTPAKIRSGIEWDGKWIWVADGGYWALYKIDPVSRKTVATVPLDFKPYYLGWDGKFLWSRDRNSRTVNIIDPDTGEIIYFKEKPDIYIYDITFEKY